MLRVPVPIIDNERKMISGIKCVVYRDRALQWVETSALGSRDGEPYRVVQFKGRITLYYVTGVAILAVNAFDQWPLDKLLAIGLKAVGK
jgi:hypothetical protein